MPIEEEEEDDDILKVDKQDDLEMNDDVADADVVELLDTDMQDLDEDPEIKDENYQDVILYVLHCSIFFNLFVKFRKMLARSREMRCAMKKK